MNMNMNMNTTTPMTPPPAMPIPEVEGSSDLDRLTYIGLNLETFSAAVETIIFLAEKPIATSKIRDSIDPTLSLRIVHQAIETLQKEYESSHHGIRLYEVSDGWQFRTKAAYSKFIKEHVKVAPLQLTPLALEVLSMIAFKQPISKVDIDRLRGVDSGHLLRGLMDKRLIRAVSKSDDPTKSTQYGTTQDFLEIFNLSKVEDLPSYSELEELAQANTVGEIQDIKAIVQSDDKTKFVFDELAELDQLSESIKSISVHTEFTSLFGHNKKDVESGEAPTGLSDLLETYLAQRELKDENVLASHSAYPIETPPPIPVTSGEEDRLSEELDLAFEKMRQQQEEE